METTTQITNRKSGVTSAVLLKHFFFLARQIGIQKPVHGRSVHDFLLLLQRAIDANHHGLALGHMNIRHRRLRRRQFLYIHSHASPANISAHAFGEMSPASILASAASPMVGPMSFSASPNLSKEKS